jgi:hypothetical protein
MTAVTHGTTARNTVEELGDLDSEDYGELAVVDHLPRGEGVGDDAEEPLAGTAALGVDVVLHLIDGRGLAAHAGHLVARVAPGLLLGQRVAVGAVVDEQVHP